LVGFLGTASSPRHGEFQNPALSQRERESCHANDK
jgi:hypothetical protein